MNQSVSTTFSTYFNATKWFTLTFLIYNGVPSATNCIWLSITPIIKEGVIIKSLWVGLCIAEFYK